MDFFSFAFDKVRRSMEEEVEIFEEDFFFGRGMDNPLPRRGNESLVNVLDRCRTSIR